MLARFARRAFSAPASASPSPPKRESTFVEIWIKRSKAAWPIIGICGVVLMFCGSFVVHSLRSPEIHFNRQERKTIDFVENDRGTAAEWKQSKFHTGPDFAHPAKRPYDRDK
ncbi:hypothetical protein BASA81_003091 [Batrachochytrium salamandrivorans]|nr:hypothetical protein BASA81_003091 [Batrachochytrium salamandrivorans]